MNRPKLIAIAIPFVLIAVAGIDWGTSDSAAGVPTYRITADRFIRQVTADGNLKAASATPVLVPMEAQGPAKIAWLAADGSPVKKDDLIVRFDATDFQNELRDGETARSTADNKIVRDDANAGATRSNLKRDAVFAERELEAARNFVRRDAGVFSRNEVVESEIDEALALERRDYAESVLGVRERLYGADRAILGIERRKADLKIGKAERALSALEVRAPHDGIFVLERDWRGETPRVGSTEWAGSEIGEIPDPKKMNAEVHVLEADAGGLAVEQQATVALESLSDTLYKAKVIRVDAVAKPRFRGNPVQYFGLTLELERTDERVMKPGARVRARLMVEEKAKALSIPRQALFDKDGKKLVYVRRGDTFKEQQVNVASATAGRIVVTSGLREGDEIALRDPNEKEDEKTETEDH